MKELTRIRHRALSLAVSVVVLLLAAALATGAGLIHEMMHSLGLTHSTGTEPSVMSDAVRTSTLSTYDTQNLLRLYPL